MELELKCRESELENTVFYSHLRSQIGAKKYFGHQSALLDSENPQCRPFFIPSSSFSFHHAMSTSSTHRTYNALPLDLPLQITKEEQEFFTLVTGIKDWTACTAHITEVQGEAYSQVRILFSSSG